jgi:hypothetical protein
MHAPLNVLKIYNIWIPIVTSLRDPAKDKEQTKVFFGHEKEEKG